MSVGRPVVATDVGGVPELVADGVTGVLSRPDRPGEIARALVELARDPARAADLGRAGRLRQQRCFSLDAMVQGYADLLVEVSRRQRRRGLVTLTGAT